MDATIPNPARIAAGAEAACELEVSTCNKVESVEKNKPITFCAHDYPDDTYMHWNTRSINKTVLH